ncbi:ferric reductase-like transmembrane domain-containing protein [Microbacterium panaciterrae]|uniref:Ferric oxidoreductase domain-containing protein n=1 Tax=Microbacterium panaciterrae TaxID=985759 RepID=A0ABP8P1V3_9MICO
MATLTSLAPGTPLVAAPARRARPALWRLAAVTLIWATSLFVLALWVSGAGIQSLLAFDGDSLTTLGRLTGLVSANLLLYQVLLMARVPVFERGFGRDGITRLHRLVGFWSFWLLMAHLVLITFGYAITSSTNVLVQAWDFVWNYPGMLLATAGTGLLILVVVTSIRRSRRRLRRRGARRGGRDRRPHRRAPGAPPRRTSRAVLHLAVPGRAGMVARTPVLAGGRPDRG